MKIRTYIQKRLIFFISLLLIGGVVFQAQAFVFENDDSLAGTALSIISGVLVLIGIVGYFILIKCPKCNKRFGNVLSYMSITSTTGERGIRHCPFCGVSFDEQL